MVDLGVLPAVWMTKLAAAPRANCSRRRQDGTRPVIDRLNQAARMSLDDPATKAQLAPQGVVLQLSTPEEFGAFLRSEVATWAKVVQDSGARVE